MPIDINITGVEKTSNKKTSLTDNSDTFYPTQKAVKTAVDGKQDTLGFTPENVANKQSDLTASSTKYPTVNAVNSGLSNKVDKVTGKSLIDDTEISRLASMTAIFTSALKTAYDSAVTWISTNGTNLINHLSNTSNPHSTTASQVGAVAVNSAITGATKTKITYDSKGLVTSGADATTADISDSTNKRYVTDAQLTVIGNTSGTNTGDETQSSILSKLGFFVYNRTSDSSAVTGTTTETIIDSVLISANTFGSGGGILRCYNAKFAKTGTASLWSIKIYIGPNAGNLTGATPIASNNSIGTSLLYAEMLRTFTVGASTIKSYSSSTNSLTDVGTTAAARTSTAWNPAIDNYIHYTVQLSNSADSVVMIGNSVKNF